MESCDVMWYACVCTYVCSVYAYSLPRTYVCCTYVIRVRTEFESDLCFFPNDPTETTTTHALLLCVYACALVKAVSCLQSACMSVYNQHRECGVSVPFTVVSLLFCADGYGSGGGGAESSLSLEMSEADM